jgi:hypothetical protein
VLLSPGLWRRVQHSDLVETNLDMWAWYQASQLSGTTSSLRSGRGLGRFPTLPLIIDCSTALRYPGSLVPIDPVTEAVVIGLVGDLIKFYADDGTAVLALLQGSSGLLFDGVRVGRVWPRERLTGQRC